MERWLSIVGGGILGLYGLSRRSVSGLGLAAVGGSMVYRGLSGHCNLYGALGLNTAHVGPSTSVPAGEGYKVEETITINRPVREVFSFWRNFSNLPRFMSHLASVEVRDHNRSHWVARGPLGIHVEWDAEVHNERDNELIAWRSLPGSDVDTAGSVHFRSRGDGQGTEVHVVLKYNPPAGKAGAAVARWLGSSPEQQIRDDLGRLKQVLESGTAAGATGHLAGAR